ncbi:SPFH domain-containing protein [Azospirillum sp. sgz302134]
MIKRKVTTYGAIGLTVVVVSLAFKPFTFVSEQERVVVTRAGQFVNVAPPGFLPYVPFVNGITRIPVDFQQLEILKANTFTDDSQEVTVDMKLTYRISAEDVEWVFKNANDYKSRLETLALGSMKATLGKHAATKLAANRMEAAREALDRITDEAKRLYKVQIVDLQYTDLQFSKGFREAVDGTAVAKAEAEKALHVKARKTTEAETRAIEAKGQADGKIEEARGSAESTRINTEADANRVRKLGDAEAYRITQEADALARNPTIIALRQAERWNGALPVQMFGASSAPVPILNIDPAGGAAVREVKSDQPVPRAR